MLSNYATFVLTVAGVNAIAAWGVGIAIRSGQLSVGHAAFAGMAGYAAGLITRDGGSIVLALVVGVLVAGLAGALVSALTLRLDHLFLALATLIFGEIMAILAKDSETLGGAAGLASIPLWTTLPVVAAFVVAILLLELFVVRGSRAEIQMQLLAHNPSLTELAGSSSKRLRVLFFGLSTSAVGVAGVLQAHLYGVVQPQDLQFARSLDFVVFAVVGGSHSGYGPMLGAVVLTTATEFIRIPGVERPVIYGVILLGVLLWRDQGLLGRWPLKIGAKVRVGKSDSQDEREPVGVAADD
jgi:branched-chain amino acid transport system permease protein